ncbi:hypothetical protein ONZ51_g9372 [Trametes cubensis]|uniref:Uncharacterized protein n=1 Tax=Trametes cubensis TaxID=1111947 RepID=A0AAD7TNZ8_9APHY|nr:hypothetical protein ONZ51_g9372 [Trametes cubensis]
MGNNPSRSTDTRSRSAYSRSRSFSKGGWNSGRRRIEYGRDEDLYDDSKLGAGYPERQAYAPPFSNVPSQSYYGQSPYGPPQPLVFPPPHMQSTANPVIPPSTMTGAIPTAGNPFPAPPMNMGMSMPSPAVPMGMPEPIIPGHGQSPEAPVIPPMPSSFRARNGTPFHRPATSPWDSSSTDDDEITQERRERMQPPLAPGQYGPYDHPDRRRDPTPALRRSHHRRAESSPVYRRDESPPYGRYTEPPVIPNDMGGWSRLSAA